MNRSFACFSVCGVVVLSWPARGAATELCVVQQAGRTQLSLCGRDPFHSTRAEVTAPRLSHVPDSPVSVVLWNESPAGGLSTPFYAVTLDGQEVQTVRGTSYDLRLRYAVFDPATTTPTMDPLLAAGVGNELYFVQFVTQPLDVYRTQLAARGATIGPFVPNHAYVVRMSETVRQQVEGLPYVRSVAPYHPAYKLEVYLSANLAQGSDLFPLEHYNVLLLERGSEQAVAGAIEAIGGAVKMIDHGGSLLVATLAPEQLVAVASWNQVVYIDRWGPPSFDMGWVRELSGANYVEHAFDPPPGYTGQGVIGEMVDSGMETTHPAFQRHPPRLHGPQEYPQEHGTEVYGIVFGDLTALPLEHEDDPVPNGLLPDAQGIAAIPWSMYDEPSRRCRSCELVCADTETCADECGAVCVGSVDPGVPYQGVFQTNSWGHTSTIRYTIDSHNFDDILLAYDLLACQCQGNCGYVGICGNCLDPPPDPYNPYAPRDPHCSRPEAWAKNALSVGGVYHRNNGDRADDSWEGLNAPPEEWGGAASYGPATDGRVKPDLVHFYDMIETTNILDYFGWTPRFGGTSAATPITCGLAGLFFQMWADDQDSDGKGIFGNPLLDPNCDPEGTENCVFKNRPHAATAKAMLINTARQYDFVDPPGEDPAPFPDLTRDKQGWGLPSVGKLYALAKANGFPVIVDETDVLLNFEHTTYHVTVPPQTAALKATLVYTDPPGALSPEPSLVNNLDLCAIFDADPGPNKYRGNYNLVDSNWSLPGGDFDSVNNVENIFIKEPLAGNWSIYVDSDSVTQDGHLETEQYDVDYALVVSLDFDCNGNGFLDS